jgi:hypothetical protein
MLIGFDEREGWLLTLLWELLGESGCVSGDSGRRGGCEVGASETNKSAGRRGCGAREAELSDIKTWHD